MKVSSKDVPKSWRSSQQGSQHLPGRYWTERYQKRLGRHICTCPVRSKCPEHFESALISFIMTPAHNAFLGLVPLRLPETKLELPVEDSLPQHSISCLDHYFTMTKSKYPDHISDRILDLCTSSETVSSLLAKEPSLSPSAAWDKLYGRNALKKRSLGVGEEEKEKESSFSGSEEEESNGQGSKTYYKSPPTPPHSPRLAQEHLDRAAKCGKWRGKKPSELFLQVLDYFLRHVMWLMGLMGDR